MKVDSVLSRIKRTVATAPSHRQAVDLLVPKFFLYPARSWTDPPGPS